MRIFAHWTLPLFAALLALALAPQRAQAVELRGAHLVDGLHEGTSTTPKAAKGQLVGALKSPTGVQLAVEHGGIVPCIAEIIPGLGQFLNGETNKALIVFVAVAVPWIVGGLIGGGIGALLEVVAVVIHIVGFVDAYKGGGVFPVGGGGDVGAAHPLEEGRMEVIDTSAVLPATRPAS